MSRSSQPLHINENTPIPVKFVSAIIGLAIACATGWAALNARIDVYSTEMHASQSELAEVKRDRAEMLKVWRQDRIDQAIFRTEVITKLDRIERKLDHAN